MSLSRHILPENLIDESNKHAHHRHAGADKNRTHSTSAYSSRYQSEAEIPKFKLPQTGCSAKQAYQLIHDELLLDGNPSLNLASFVHTWMPEEADKLMMENIGKNLVDQDEYPSATLIHNRCVSMIADLWHAPDSKKAIGTATTGSSEAIMLGGLALKKRWQEKMKKAGKDHYRPNVIMGAEAQVALEKFARYFDVECRLVPISVESNYVLDVKKAAEMCDENTIGVFVILGSTYTGHYENVQAMSDELDRLQAEKGLDIPIHVDGASGAFVAPFAHPSLKWDFQIPRVHSINASGHKFGMSYVGVGWVVWRDETLLPKDLIFELHYLGSTEYSFSLNFSRPAHPIIGQYFLLINLGFEGYREIMLNNLRNARTLSNALEASNVFTVLSDIHRRRKGGEDKSVLDKTKEAVGLDEDVDEDDIDLYEMGLPVVSFRFTDEFKKQYPDIKQAWVQSLLRLNGWIAPNYALAPDVEEIEILRVVVRESMSGDMVERFVEALMSVMDDLIDQEGPYVAQAKADRSKQKNKGLEHAMGSLNVDDKKDHKSGTYAKPC